MTPQEIQRLSAPLSSAGPYFQLGFRDKPDKLLNSTRAERLALAWADPAFGLNVPRTYAAAGQPLPGNSWPPEVLRVYEVLRDPSRNDPDIQWVLKLNEPGYLQERKLLCSLLLCFELTIEEVAARLYLRPAQVRAFEILCFNCRDRKGDRVYQARLCQIAGYGYGEGRPGEFNGSENVTLLELAFQKGSSELVLTAESPGRAPASALAALEQYQLERMLRSVLVLLKQGKVDKEENPWLELILERMPRVPSEQSGPASSASGPNLPEAIGLTFNQGATGAAHVPGP